MEILRCRSSEYKGMCMVAERKQRDVQEFSGARYFNRTKLSVRNKQALGVSERLDQETSN